MSATTNDDLIPGIDSIKPITPPAVVNGAEPNCANCRHAFESPHAPKGHLLCRRNPPSATVVMVPVPVNQRLVKGRMEQDIGMAPKVFTVFPEVNDKMGCGAHEVRARAAAQALPIAASWSQGPAGLDARGAGDDPT